MRLQHLSRLLVLPFCAVSMALASCSTSRYEPIPETGATLEGTVKYNGETLKAARVLVSGAAGGSTGDIGENGRYLVTRAPLGDVSIGVDTDEIKNLFMAAAAGAAAEGRKVSNPKVIDVPRKYADVARSAIKTTIKPGPNTFDIVIEDKKDKEPTEKPTADKSAESPSK